MERVSTLIQKLQQQLDENATAERLLLTVQMLYAELIAEKQTSTHINTEKVFVMMPAVLSAITENRLNSKDIIRPAEPEITTEEKIIEVL
ncbi:MAG: hypothetical protein ABIN97_04550, partial [Ginsengibacter sp.]